MRKPTVRSLSSSSSASTSSINASESASRSSTNDWPSLIVDGSISRMSASRSRTISKISSRPSGPCSTWVSAGIATKCYSGLDGIPDLVDDAVVDHLLGDPDTVRHRLGLRRAVGDGADAVYAEQDRAPVRVRVERLVQRQQRRQQRVGVRLVLGL